jgi:hypothetical protein
MNMRQWLNDIGKAKLKDSERNTPQCHFAHHDILVEWPSAKAAADRVTYATSQ